MPDQYGCLYCSNYDDVPRPRLVFLSIVFRNRLAEPCRRCQISKELDLAGIGIVQLVLDGTSTFRENKLPKVMRNFIRCPEYSYWVIDNVFSLEQCQRMKMMRRFDMWEPINFDGEDKRFQKNVYHNWNRKYPVETLSGTGIVDFMLDFKRYNPPTKYFTVKLLKSYSGCQRQKFHTDDVAFSRSVDADRNEHAPYSIIVSLEPNDNPTRIYFRDRRITLWPGSVLIMRGDCVHAGADYDQLNYRLFIATGTYRFENKGTTVNLHF